MPPPLLRKTATVIKRSSSVTAPAAPPTAVGGYGGAQSPPAAPPVLTQLPPAVPTVKAAEAIVPYSNKSVATLLSQPPKYATIATVIASDAAFATPIHASSIIGTPRPLPPLSLQQQSSGAMGERSHPQSSGGMGERSHPQPQSKKTRKQDESQIERNVELWSLSDAAAQRIPSVAREESTLWTEKYRPHTLEDYYCDITLVRTITAWITEWQTYQRVRATYFAEIKATPRKRGRPPNQQQQQQQPQPQSHSVYGGHGGSSPPQPILLLHGTAGIGKTTLAHIIFNKWDYDVIEINASDLRNKKHVRDLLGKIAAYSLTDLSCQRSVGLIMDEIDGMMGGDIGGVAEMAAILKETPIHIPIIATCNNIKDKITPIIRYCQVIQMKPPTAAHSRELIDKICAAEQVHIPSTVRDACIAGDYRLTINNLYQIALSQRSRRTIDMSATGVAVSLLTGTHDHIVKGDSIIERLTYTIRPSMLAKLDKLKFTDYYVYATSVHFNMIYMLGQVQPPSQVKAKGAAAGKQAFLTALSELIELYDDYLLCECMNEYVYSVQNWQLVPYIEAISIVHPIAVIIGKMVARGMEEFRGIGHYNQYNMMRQEQCGLIKYCNSLDDIASSDAISLYYKRDERVCNKFAAFP
jgi:DNA polymerase III delta prime subunit